jgi:hypothetical protein
MKTIVLGVTFVLCSAAALVSGQSHNVVYDPALYQNTNINRQGGASAGLFSSLGSSASGFMNSLVASLPNMLTNALPALAVLGLGGLLLPLLGVSLFLREGQKRTFSLPTINPAILEGIADVLDRVSKAIEQSEKKYAKN